MPAPSITCPDCGEIIAYWHVHCRCGHFVGFPNYREAAAERDELLKRHAVAQDDATVRGVASLLVKLDALVEQSRPVIAMPFSVCDDILRPDKYRNYDQRVDSGERDPATAEHHAIRAMVSARLFPMYGEHIQYAALSPDGRGLASYGSVAVRWDVTPSYLGRRASLLEENSFMFYDRHGLGRRDATIPPGHRAVWEDRAKLMGAKLASRLNPATDESALPGLMLRGGRTRNDDDFIEIAVFADRGLDTRDVNLVTLQRVPTTSEEAHRWELVRETCAARGIALVE